MKGAPKHICLVLQVHVGARTQNNLIQLFSNAIPSISKKVHWFFVDVCKYPVTGKPPHLRVEKRDEKHEDGKVFPSYHINIYKTNI